MLILDAGPTWAFVTGGELAEVTWLQGILSFYDPDSVFTRGPARVSLIDAMNRFPAGLCHMIRGLGKQAGIEVQINWAPATLPALDISTDELAAEAGLGWLRPYQLDAVRRLLVARRGLVHFPVAAGKTEVMAAAAKATGGWWVLMAHSADLVKQGADRVTARTGIPIGTVDKHGVVRVDGKVCKDPSQSVIIPITTQWIHRNLQFSMGLPLNTALDEWCRLVNGLCVDEAHRCGAPTAFDSAMRFSGTSYRLGLSGSLNEQGPLRAAKAFGAVGVIIHEIDNHDLIEAGFVSSGTIHMIPVGHVPPRAGVWAGVYIEQIVKSRDRAALVARVIQQAPKPCMIFVDDLANGHMLNTAVAARQLGVPTATVNGDVPNWQRAETIKRLRHGEYDAIVCTEVFQEGVDIPELAAVVVATGGKSAVAAIQRLGRATRRTEDKDTFVLYDFFDHTIGADRESPAPYKWCEHHARARARAYMKQGHRVVVGPLEGPTEPYHPRWKPI